MTKATLNQAQQLLNLIAQSGIERSNFQDLLESGKLTTLLHEYVEGATFEVAVDGHEPLTAAIDRGNFEVDCVSRQLRDYFSRDIHGNRTCLPEGETSPKLIRIHLLHVGRRLTVAQGNIELGRRGLRPVVLRELCALGEFFPFLQLQFPILALGSKAETEDEDDLRFPFLTEDCHQRSLEIFRTSQMGKIPDSYRLAGVRR